MKPRLIDRIRLVHAALFSTDVDKISQLTEKVRYPPAVEAIFLELDELFKENEELDGLARRKAEIKLETLEEMLGPTDPKVTHYRWGVETSAPLPRTLTDPTYNNENGGEGEKQGNEKNEEFECVRCGPTEGVHGNDCWHETRDKYPTLSQNGDYPVYRSKDGRKLVRGNTPYSRMIEEY